MQFLYALPIGFLHIYVFNRPRYTIFITGGLISLFFLLQCIFDYFHQFDFGMIIILCFGCFIGSMIGNASRKYLLRYFWKNSTRKEITEND